MLQSSSMLMLLAFVTTFVEDSCAEAEMTFKADFDEIEEMGKWSHKWLGSDTPQGAGGDMETVSNIRRTYGTKCRDSVYCDEPLMMKVRLSAGHREKYENSNLTEIFGCTILNQDATDPMKGFYCLNDQQKNANPSTECLRLCEKNGQTDIYDNDYKTNGTPNCGRCADFDVKFFCLNSKINCADPDFFNHIDVDNSESTDKEPEVEFNKRFINAFKYRGHK